MAEASTFIKLDRNIKKWRWYKDANTMRVFIHLLIGANIEAHDFMKTKIKRGEMATSYKSISESVGITVSQTRTAIDHLKLTGEIAVKQYPKFQVISILNYNKYQDKPQGKSQSSRSQAAVKSQQSKKDISKDISKNEKNKGAPPASPLSGEQAPAIGSGDCMITLDGINHRFPPVWYELAEKAGKTIEDYVNWRHQ